MKNFKEGGGFGGNQRFGGGANKNSFHKGGGKFGGGQSRGFKGGDRPKERNNSGDMFSATCATCGKPCEVPFRPAPDKPVYCSACFGKKSQEMNREFRGDAPEPKFKKGFRAYKEEEKAEKDHNKGHEELKSQLSSLEGKVNRILDMLNAQIHAEVATVATEIQETIAKVRKPKTLKAPKKAVKKEAKKTVKKSKK